MFAADRTTKVNGVFFFSYMSVVQGSQTKDHYTDKVHFPIDMRWILSRSCDHLKPGPVVKNASVGSDIIDLS